jgi:hypothetical protein
MTASLAVNGEIAAFLRTESTVVVSAASPGGVPELCLGLACLIDADGRRLRAVFDQRSAGPLLDLVAGGCDRVALVGSRPTDLRTVQVKGHGATLEPLPVSERAEVARVLAAMRIEFGRVGFGDPYASTLLDHDPAALVCIGFVPDAVFEQTPGPRAGQALGAAAEGSP